MSRLSNRQVSKAGEALKNNLETKADLDIISTFRINHIYIMKMLAKTIGTKLPKPYLIARRLKRLSSIQTKLLRFR